MTGLGHSRRNPVIKLASDLPAVRAWCCLVALIPRGLAVQCASGLQLRQPTQPKASSLFYVVGAVVTGGKMPRLDSLMRFALGKVCNAFFCVFVHNRVFHCNKRYVTIPQFAKQGATRIEVAPHFGKRFALWRLMQPSNAGRTKPCAWRVHHRNHVPALVLDDIAHIVLNMPV